MSAWENIYEIEMETFCPDIAPSATESAFVRLHPGTGAKGRIDNKTPFFISLKATVSWDTVFEEIPRQAVDLYLESNITSLEAFLGKNGLDKTIFQPLISLGLGEEGTVKIISERGGHPKNG
ncbi:hypothetical protein CW354_19195 [Marinicaulis flavus]|uniref:Uncharacterized protein n=2 Tax=Hyphococcus luteus TaxID=2058213 RepID=A0A2S7K1T2_9PROT|nr:hypothetical protein CW354_19195 [Marinicaulis flavus]